MYSEKVYYLEQCAKERWSKRELERQIDSALFERYKLGQPIISPVVREIAPRAEQIFRDQYILEFLVANETVL